MSPSPSISVHWPFFIVGRRRRTGVPHMTERLNWVGTDAVMRFSWDG